MVRLNDEKFHETYVDLSNGRKCIGIVWKYDHMFSWLSPAVAPVFINDARRNVRGDNYYHQAYKVLLKTRSLDNAIWEVWLA